MPEPSFVSAWAFSFSGNLYPCARTHTALDYNTPYNLEDYKAGIRGVFQT
jgi:hypothetical protein